MKEAHYQNSESKKDLLREININTSNECLKSGGRIDASSNSQKIKEVNISIERSNLSRGRTNGTSRDQLKMDINSRVNHFYRYNNSRLESLNGLSNSQSKVVYSQNKHRDIENKSRKQLNIITNKHKKKLIDQEKIIQSNLHQTPRKKPPIKSNSKASNELNTYNSMTSPKKNQTNRFPPNSSKDGRPNISNNREYLRDKLIKKSPIEPNKRNFFYSDFMRSQQQAIKPSSVSTITPIKTENNVFIINDDHVDTVIQESLFPETSFSQSHLEAADMYNYKPKPDILEKYPKILIQKTLEDFQSFKEASLKEKLKSENEVIRVISKNFSCVSQMLMSKTEEESKQEGMAEIERSSLKKSKSLEKELEIKEKKTQNQSNKVIEKREHDDIHNEGENPDKSFGYHNNRVLNQHMESPPVLYDELYQYEILVEENETDDQDIPFIHENESVPLLDNNLQSTVTSDQLNLIGVDNYIPNLLTSFRRRLS